MGKGLFAKLNLQVLHAFIWECMGMYGLIRELAF